MESTCSLFLDQKGRKEKSVSMSPFIRSEPYRGAPSDLASSSPLNISEGEGEERQRIVEQLTGRLNKLRQGITEKAHKFGASSPEKRSLIAELSRKRAPGGRRGG